MAAGNHSLGTIRGTIEIDYDGAGIVKAVRDTEKAKGSFGNLDSASNKVLGSFGKFAKGAAVTAGAVNLLNNSIGLVAGALAVAGPLAAAGFAAAPGIMLAYQGAMVIARIATEGMGKALGAAGDDAEKFNKAIEELSPEAQKFAKAFRAAYPALEKVKDGIQDAFFNNTAGQVAGVVQRISTLQVVASGVARAMSQVAQQIVRFATSNRSLTGIKAILGGVRDFLYQIQPVIGRVVQEFIALGGQMGQFGKTIGGSLANGLSRFADFLSRIDIKALFAEALPIVQSLASFFGDLFAIAKQLLGVFATDGANAAGILAEMASQLAAFLESAEGQAALQALGQALKAISGAAGQIFLALLQALAPAIVALAPGVAQLAGQIAAVLVPAINALNPLLTSLATFLSENMDWLGPLAGVVLAAAAAYKTYAAGAAAVAAVQGFLSGRLVAAAAAWVANTAAMVASRVAAMAVAVAMGVVRIATLAWTAAQWAFNAALAATGIPLIIAAIVALVAIIIYAYKNNETFRKIVQQVWAAIKKAIGAVVDWIVGTVWPSLKRAWDQLQSATQALWGAIKAIWNGIKTAISVSLNAIRAVVRAVWNGIVTAVRTYINLVKAVVLAGFNAAKGHVTSVMNAVRNVVRTVWAGIVAVVRSQINAVKNVINGVRVVISVIRNAFNSARSAVSSALNSLVSLVRGLPRRVSGALGNLAGLLYGKGKALIQGFINGIKAMAGRVAGAVKGIVGNVTKFLPGSPAKEGPLSGRGYVFLRAQRFMKDFAKGIESGREKPAAALYGTTDGLARAVVPATSRARSRAIETVNRLTGGGDDGGDVIYAVSVGNKPFFDLVVDAVSNRPIEVRKASDEGARRSMWAGSGR